MKAFKEFLDESAVIAEANDLRNEIKNLDSGLGNKLKNAYYKAFDGVYALDSIDIDKSKYPLLYAELDKLKRQLKNYQ